VLNKSAIVLITAIWEAYCEDIAAEALAHIVANVARGSKLPTDLKKKIASELKTPNRNDLAVWDLADDGWKTVVQARLAQLTAERSRKLNTPKSANIDELFATAIGLPSVSSAWRWGGMPAARARTKLDKYITLRGAIAHRGKSATGCKKWQVTDYFRHVRQIGSRTGGQVNSFVKRVTGKRLWSNARGALMVSTVKGARPRAGRP
jgi:hypothetical protein